MRNTATTMTPMFHNQTEHQQQHKLEEEQRAFEKQFDMIENSCKMNLSLLKKTQIRMKLKRSLLELHVRQKHQ